MHRRPRTLVAVAALVATATFGLAVDDATAADRAVAAKPRLVSGAAAKKIVASAIADEGKHGPYRRIFSLTVTVQKGQAPQTLSLTEDVVPPDRAHTWIGPIGAGIEQITIGTTTWARLGPKEKWQQGPDSGKQQPFDLTAKDLASAVEVRSRAKNLRTFKIVARVTERQEKLTFAGTVVIDRQGRLRSLLLHHGKEAALRMTVTYNSKIVVRPPA